MIHNDEESEYTSTPYLVVIMMITIGLGIKFSEVVTATEVGIGLAVLTSVLVVGVVLYFLWCARRISRGLTARAKDGPLFGLPVLGH